MITANVIHRVFRVKRGQKAGTAFTVDTDGKQYLVTAKHVVPALGGNDTVEVFSNGNWHPMGVRLVGCAHGDIDICVLSADRQLTPPDLPLEASSKGLTYGQDVYFLGFPYDILSKYILGEEGYPLPLVKKAIVSCLSVGVHLLDGHSNPGFSGGPVVFAPPGSKQFKVCGVISGCKAIEQPVYARGDPTPLVYRYNTGIIVSYPVEHALEVIRSNPVGLELGRAGSLACPSADTGPVSTPTTSLREQRGQS